MVKVIMTVTLIEGRIFFVDRFCCYLLMFIVAASMLLSATCFNVVTFGGFLFLFVVVVVAVVVQINCVVVVIYFVFQCFAVVDFFHKNGHPKVTAKYFAYIIVNEC